MDKIKAGIWIWVTFCIIGSATAQEPLQTIRGRVIDNHSDKPISGADVRLLNAEPVRSTTTDDEGRFRLEGLTVGRYQLEISHLSYRTRLYPELLLESGKETVLEVQLENDPEELSPVEVKAERPTSELTPLSTYIVTVEQTRRLPATFYDPARMIMTYPGVAGTSDQANHLSIRGHSPNHLAWRLEGADIVNPNHLTNAGTFNDRASQNGGGVNILSAQMLGTSTFRSGPLPAAYGNALSGVLDMYLRKGNDERREYTAQLGLIGLDFATEGPISSKQHSSYLINYRYSTLGLLSALGVDLGDEEINFQDLSLHLDFPTRRAGHFSIFAMGGISENVFEAPRDTAAREFDKDRFDIQYKSKMGAAGMTHMIGLGTNAVVKSLLVYSVQETNRIAEELDRAFMPISAGRDFLSESRLSFRTSYIRQLNRKSRIEIGGMITQYHFDLNVSPGENPETRRNRAKGDQFASMVEPFAQMEISLLQNLKIKPGLRYRYFGLYDQGSLEPRLAINWIPVKNHIVKLAYGLHSQLQQSILFYERNFQDSVVNNLKAFTKTQHFVLGYTYQPDPANLLTAEIYYQKLSNFPLSSGTNSTFSGINLISGFPAFTNATALQAEGQGTNYGIELGYTKYLTNHIFLLLNGSLFESRYTDPAGMERDTRFNSRYIFNATGGKEWVFEKENKKKILGINLRLNYHGGFRDTPIDEISSEAAGYTVYKEEEAFSIDPADYYKLDLRISLKNNKSGYSSTVALDIQNVTNKENIAYTYYDIQQQAIVTEYQLGLIPILSYRIEF